MEVVNPARAGMIRCDSLTTTLTSGKPRASGDDPRAGGRDVSTTG